ncbi:MAG: 5-deoxy-glucuronate isomerase [Acidimicrobiales bacterium]
MSHPLCLRSGQVTDGTDTVAITPESAGWSYTGLRVIELEPGGERALETGSAELAVLPLAGSCVVEAEAHRFELTGRRDVFSRVSDFAYIPIGTEVRITSAAGGRFAIPSARATHRFDPSYGPAEEVPVEVRGAGSATRQVNNFMAPAAFPCDKLVAVEVITPAGNWSSYPPHKHDECREGEAVLEEIYYFETSRCGVPAGRSMGEGFALQRLYSTDGKIDLCEEVRHGDVVLVPRGYHGPSAAAPGYDLYYLNVLAGPGPERTMAFCDDPAHHWARDAWAHDKPDPRLPFATAAGPRQAVR